MDREWECIQVFLTQPNRQTRECKIYSYPPPIGVAVGGDSGQADKVNASSYLRDGVGTTATPIL